MKQEYIIGDVVMYNNKIMVIKEPRDGTHFDLSCPEEKLVYCCVGVEDIKPVNITPTILKKNGWKKHKRSYSRDYCYRQKGYPTLNIRSEKEVYFHWGDHDESITTIHQLQHLLLGLGIDFDFNLGNSKKGGEK